MISGLHNPFSRKAHEFPKDFTWLNADKPISIDTLKGQVVILDFWTYCCINCMHMLRTLSAIEERYKDKPVIVIGVHSAKFEAERDPKNIKEAISRYGVKHPVIVDRKMRIWNSYGAAAWPTIIVMNPEGRIVYKGYGEISGDVIQKFVDQSIWRSEAAGTLASGPLITTPQNYEDASVLSYPGKLAISEDGSYIAVSDSNHNRILVVGRKTGKIKTVIGAGSRGLRDGTLSGALFFRPQGLVWVGDIIYVADTENHAIREIDLKSNSVKTIAGNGMQGPYVAFAYTNEAKSISLSSPWDLAFKDGKLYVAMAGLHQIWVYHVKAKAIGPYAGSGAENISDGTLEAANFAQPSGLSIGGNKLYVADSESSSIRSLDTKTGYVATLAGAGLFIFGKGDGALNRARFQHPIGLSANNGVIYVADTYNNAVREISIKEKRVTTLIAANGSQSFCRFDDPGCDALGLFEPNDVKAYGNMLYIADTNNHLVRVFDLKTRLLNTLDLKA